MRPAAVAAMLALGLALPAVARAEQYGPGLLSTLHYGVTGGGMLPAGPQGRELRRGGHLGAEAFGETNLGFQFGAEGSYTLSSDALRTRIAHGGVFARLSPTPEDYRLYVQLGLGAYDVSYHPKLTGLAKPESLFRPGGSFALGAEFAQLGDITVGASGAYHGIMLYRHHALAFGTIRLHVTYQRLGL